MEPTLSKPFAFGRTAEVYDWGRQHILKLYYDWCPPQWVENESKVVHAVVAAGIPTPAAKEIIEIKGRRGIVYERMTGISMLQDMNARPWMIFRHARALAELHVQVNQLSVPGLYSFKNGMEDALRNALHLSDDLRASLLDLLPALPDGDKLCHGDFHPGNVMLTPQGPVVIDWMTASIGNPWADFTRTSLLLTIGPKAAGNLLSPPMRMFIHIFYRTYVQHYLTILPDRQHERKQWIPLVAAARLNERIERETQALVEMVKRGLNPES
jgi:hypothetical protein